MGINVFILVDGKEIPLGEAIISPAREKCLLEVIRDGIQLGIIQMKFGDSHPMFRPFTRHTEQHLATPQHSVLTPLKLERWSCDPEQCNFHFLGEFGHCCAAKEEFPARLVSDPFPKQE